MTLQTEIPFYNTIPLRGKELEKAIDNAITQDQIIFAYFKKHPDKEFTPCDVWNCCFNIHTTPLTSVRRTITNLEKEGLLKKTGNFKTGDYGMKNNTWKIKMF